MKSAPTLALTLLVASLPAVVAAQSNPLGNLLGRIIKPSSGQPFGVPSYLARQSFEQVNALKGLVAAKFTQGDLAQIAPLAGKVLAIGACAQSSQAWNQTNRDRLQPYNFQQYDNDAPMERMQYHDKNYCLDVVRISEVTRPAANAVRFTAFYVSALSQQASNQSYEFQKTPDGNWLIRAISQQSGT